MITDNSIIENKTNNNSNSKTSIKTIGIIGAGAMGRGIAQIAMLANIKVKLYDSNLKATQDAEQYIFNMLDKITSKQKISSVQCIQAKTALACINDLAQLADVDLVIEAIIEDLAIKQQLFKELESIVSQNCILTSNTSSLSITEIASCCNYPNRFAGFHFFNPVPLMKIVEVVAGIRTDTNIIAQLKLLGEQLGHYAITINDSPGFLINHAGRAYITEACKLVNDGIVDFYSIDQIMKSLAKFKMGPFELLDLTGLDVTHNVIELIYNQYYQEPRLRPTILTALRLKAGLLGRKTGQGFYKYIDGVQIKPEIANSHQKNTEFDSGKYPVWIAKSDDYHTKQFTDLIKSSGATIETSVCPSNLAICFMLSKVNDSVDAIINAKLDPKRTLVIDNWFDINNLCVVAKNPCTNDDYLNFAINLLNQNDMQLIAINSSPGFVAARIIAVIINNACEIAQQQIAQPIDIDKAMQLGLGYPQGALAWGDALGSDSILALLDELYSFYGDPRYRASAWLKRRVKLGVSLLTPE